jgi:hypothetical protein
MTKAGITLKLAVYSIACILTELAVSPHGAASAERVIPVLAEAATREVAQRFISQTNSVLKAESGEEVSLRLEIADGPEISKRILDGVWMLALISPELLALSLPPPLVGAPAPVMSLAMPARFNEFREAVAYQNSSDGQFILDSLGRHDIVGLGLINTGASQVLIASGSGSFSGLTKGRQVLVTSKNDAYVAQDFSLSPVEIRPEQASEWLDNNKADSIWFNAAASGGQNYGIRLDKYTASAPLKFNVGIMMANARDWFGVPFSEREAIGQAVRVTKARQDEALLKTIDSLASASDNSPQSPAHVQFAPQGGFYVWSPNKTSFSTAVAKEAQEKWFNRLGESQKRAVSVNFPGLIYFLGEPYSPQIQTPSMDNKDKMNDDAAKRRRDGSLQLPKL